MRGFGAVPGAGKAFNASGPNLFQSIPGFNFLNNATLSIFVWNKEKNISRKHLKCLWSVYLSFY
jgi:hypothetical protein